MSQLEQNTAIAVNGIPPTGNRVEITGIVFWRIVDGQIKERRATLDTHAMLTQLGVG